MVAYSFKPRFSQPILDGVKLHTIRPEGRRRHARPGEELQLYTGMRTKHCRLVSREQCSGVLPVSIDICDEQIIVSDGYPWPSPFVGHSIGDGWRVSGPCFSGAELLDPFARRDGFSGWDEMRAFWIEEHGEPEEGDVFIGKLIGWWPK